MEQHELVTAIPVYIGLSPIYNFLEHIMYLEISKITAAYNYPESSAYGNPGAISNLNPFAEIRPGSY